MSTKSQMFCAYMGLAFPLVFFLGWGLIAGYMLPLEGPRQTAAEWVDFYSDNTTLIRVGLIITIAAAAFQVPFSALIGTHMRRMEGSRHTPLAYAQMMMGSVSVLLVIVPCFVWAAVSFRPETRDPATLLFFNDLAWLMFVGAFSPAVIQSLVLAFAIFGDKRENPILPRWAGYYNVWVATLFLPGAIVLIAKSGPFAWHGLMAFWVPATVFGTWFFVMFVLMRKAIHGLAEEEAAAERELAAA